MYEKELQQLGLSEKESRIYLASLELGPASAQNIALKADINRPTTYVQIESLKSKGLMSEAIKGGRTLYVAESPERLGSLLAKAEKELELSKEELIRVLPALASLFSGAGEKPLVRFFEGIEGAKAMREDYLRMKGKTVIGFSNLDKLFDVFPKHEEEYSKRRIEAGIRSKAIYTRKAGPLEGDTDPAKLRQAKFISHDKFPVSADITVYDNKVAIVTYKKEKPVGVVIESQEIADTVSAIFSVMWENL